MCLHRCLDLIVFYLAGGSNGDSVSNSIVRNCGVHCQCEKRCDAGFENETDETDQILVSRACYNLLYGKGYLDPIVISVCSGVGDEPRLDDFHSYDHILRRKCP